MSEFIKDSVDAIKQRWGSLEVLCAVNQALRSTENLHNLTSHDVNAFIDSLKEQGFKIVFDTSQNVVPSHTPIDILAETIAEKLVERLYPQNLNQISILEK